MAKEYTLLIGKSGDKKQELHNKEEVADFICTEGLKNDLQIFRTDGVQLISTFGVLIDRILDMEYREELLKVLLPKQIEVYCSDNVEENISEDSEYNYENDEEHDFLADGFIEVN